MATSMIGSMQIRSL